MKTSITLTLLSVSLAAYTQSWQPNSPDIFFTGGKVGIGTNTPQSGLHVSATPRYNLRLYADGNSTNYLSLWQGSGGAGIDPINTGLLYLGYDQPTSVIIGNAGGSLGIGTGSTQSSLHISATPRYNLRLYATGNSSNYLSLWQGSGGAAIDPINTGLLYLGYDQPIKVAIGRNNEGSLGIGTDSPNAKLHIPNGDAILGGSPSLNPTNLNSTLCLISKDTSPTTYPFYVGQPAGTDIFWVNGNGNGYFFGNVGIGTTTPGSFKLAVNGKVWAQEVQVAINNPGPDYVFEPSYKLLSLEEIKSYIEKHKHLPEVPSAKEMETNGVNVSEMNMLLLRKIEELTLHLIEQNKINEEQRNVNKKLLEEIKTLNDKLK